MRKRILYAILPVCLLFITFAGCDDDLVEPLPEAVPLAVEISGKSFVMGEVLTLTVKVNDANNPDLTSNEDFDVYLTAKDGDTDVTQKAFTDFPEMVTFRKGEKVLQIPLHITSDGLAAKEKLNVNVKAFVRGYTVANSANDIVIADHHYTVISLKTHTDGVINEGDNFIVQAEVPVPVADDLNINISVPGNQEAFYSELPATLKIKAGEKQGEVTVVTINNPEKTQDETLSLNFVTLSSEYPLENGVLKLTMKDTSSGKGDMLTDERWVYDNPREMFVSAKNQSDVQTWMSTAEIRTMAAGDSHPNGELAAEGWKFYTAMEFHQITACYSQSTRKTPNGFAAQNTAPIQALAAVDNSRFSDVTNDGYLRMWSMKVPSTATGGASGKRDYGSSAFYSGKGKWAPGNYRILPGVRMEFRLRSIGNKRGCNMAIWLMGTSNFAWPANGEVDILENPAYTNDDHRAFQTLHSSISTENLTGDKSVTTGPITISTMNDWNIYWFEWSEDAQTIKFGINGKTTKTINKADYGDAPWAFDLTTNPTGFYLIMSLGLGSKWAVFGNGNASEDLPVDWDNGFSSYNNYERDYMNSNLPGMEIDWIRLYTQKDKDTYQKQSVDNAEINKNFTLW